MVQPPKLCRSAMATAAQLLLLCALLWPAGHAAEADEREEPVVAASSKLGVDLVPAATTHSVGYGHHLHPFYFQGGIDEQRRYSCALQGEWKPIVHDSGGYVGGHSSYGPSGDPSLHHHHHHHQEHHQPHHDDGLEAAGLELHAAAADASGAAYLLPPPAPSAPRPRPPSPPPPPPPPPPQPSPASPPHSQAHQGLPQALPLLGKGKPAPGKVRGRPLPPPPPHKGKYRKQPFGPKPYGGVPLKLTPLKGGDLNGRPHPYHNYIPIGRPLPHNHKYSPQDLRGGGGNGVGGEQYHGTSPSPAPVHESSSSISGDAQAPPSAVAGADTLVADVVGDAGLLPAHPHLNLLHPPEVALVPQVHLVAAGAPVQVATPPQLFQHLQQLQAQQLQNQQNLQAEQQLQVQYHRQVQQQLQAQAQQQQQAQAQQQLQAQSHQQQQLQAQQQHLQVQVGGAGNVPLPPAQALTAPQPSQAQQGFVVHVQSHAQQPFPGHALDLNAQAQQDAYAAAQAQANAQQQAQQHAQQQAQQQAQQHAQQQAQHHAQQQAQHHAQQQAQHHAQQQTQHHAQQQAQHHKQQQAQQHAQQQAQQHAQQQAQQHAQQQQHQGQAHVQQIGQHVEVTIQESQSVQLDSQAQGTQHQLLLVGSHVGGGSGNAGGHAGQHVVGGHVGGELLSCTASGHYQVQDALPAASEDQAVAGSVLYEALDLGQEQQQHLVAVGTPRGRALPAPPPRAPHDVDPAAAVPVASVAAGPAWHPPPGNFQRGPSNGNGRRAKNYHGTRPGPVPAPAHGHTHGPRFHRLPPPPPPPPTRYNALAHGRYAPQYTGPHKNARVMYVPYGGYGDMYAP